jgi:DNA-directed RNA polymerase specialized sigma24 family protein
MGYTGSPDGAPQQPAGGEPARPGSRPARRSPRNWFGTPAAAAALQPLEGLYHAHYTSLVRLAALLTGDAILAESVAADSMAALLAGPFGVRRPEPPLSWLHRQVVVRSRRAARGSDPGTAGSGTGSPDGSDPAADRPWGSAPVVGLLVSLSASQREAVVLRHYLELSDEETAAVMGASLRAVRRSLQAARLALAPVLADGTGPGQA